MTFDILILFPEKLPNQHNPLEYRKEISDTQASLSSIVDQKSFNNDNNNNSSNILGDADTSVMLHVPFSTRELFWQQDHHV